MPRADIYDEDRTQGPIEGISDAGNLPKSFAGSDFRMVARRLAQTGRLSHNKPKKDDAFYRLTLFPQPAFGNVTLMAETPAPKNAPEHAWPEKFDASLAVALSSMVAANEPRHDRLDLNAA